MKFDVWSEGYAATGEHGTAMCHRLGVEAGNFQDACDQVFRQSNPLVRDASEGQPTWARQPASFDSNYDRDRLTYWGCLLFPDENEARKSYG